MLKNKKTKLLLVMLLTISLITPFSFADDETTSAEAPSVEETPAVTGEATTSEDAISEDEDETTPENQDIHEGDLYLADQDVVMDKLVNGNVYIFANSVKVTGQIAGNLFIAANKVEFDDAYIQSSTFIAANEVNFKAVTTDLYIACSSLEIPEDYGVYRDLKSFSNKLTILGIIGRNVDCSATNISLSQDDKKASIYGDFNYSSTSEIEVPEDSVEGNVNYTMIVENDTDSEKAKSVIEYIVSGVSAIVFTLVIYGLALLFAKPAIEKSTKIASSVKWSLLSIVFGIASFIVVPIISIALLISTIGVSLSFVLLGFYILLWSISKSVFSISYGNVISKKLKISNKWLEALVIACLSLVVYLLGIIPILGFIIKILVVSSGFGILFTNIFLKNINFKKETKSKKEDKAEKETK